MRLTRHTNYALRMLMYCGSKNSLAQDEAKGTLATIKEISAFYGLSEKFLTKILLSLTKHGFMTTVRGRHGGICLAMPADEIYLGDVIRKVEENFELAECFQAGEVTCPLVHACGLNQALSRALEGFFDTLNEYTLDDLIQKQHNINVLVELTTAIDTPQSPEKTPQDIRVL
ncbi:MAG: Rrf2 family transcriptional regulator [Pseudomonadota bacterium]